MFDSVIMDIHKCTCKPATYHIAPSPGPSLCEREGLVYTVCACSIFPVNTGNSDIIVYLSVLFLCNRAPFHCKRDP